MEDEADRISLVAGLGNPGPEYAGTRHNAGFLVLARIGQRIGPPRRSERDAVYRLQSYTFKGRTVRLLTPLTFMNESGKAVKRVVDDTGVSPSAVLLICDCLDLPLGRIRLRPAGSSGGHRGVESVIQELGTSAFPRLRVGIGNPGSEAIEHVLSPWDPAELEVVGRVLDRAAEAVVHVLEQGVESAMNRFNGWFATPVDTGKTQGEQAVENL